MANQTEIHQSSSGSLLGWFRKGKPRGESTHAQTAGQLDLARQARIELLNSVSAFIVDNDLHASAKNLLAARAIAAGDSPRLARKVKQRLSAGEPITQQWLDTMLEEESHQDGLDDVKQLMSQAEQSIQGFSATSRAAHSASSAFGSELEKHSDKLGKARDTGEIVNDLAELARVMLSQTRKIEEEMRQSENEANSLRKSLELAKRDAEIDHLTGLANRRAFEALLDEKYKKAAEAIEPLCVALCDIDHFKKINDTHGHDTGDRVIKAIAETLAKISDDHCHVARHGGEEFVMLFCNLSASEAYARLDQVREKLAARNFVSRKTDQPIGQVTFSGGIAEVFTYTDPREALAAADDALYRAKESGRNQIVLARRSEQ